MTKSLTAEFQVLPGCEDRVRDLVLELTTRVREEPGNMLFLPYVSADDSRRYVIFEQYRDENAFQSHLAAEYGASFNAALGELIVGETSTLTMLDSVESR
ncbi:MAG: putative quinol monooxygenase [Rhodoglobus sp.]